MIAHLKGVLAATGIDPVQNSGMREYGYADFDWFRLSSSDAERRPR